jgi:N-acetylglucosaminyldiphosphoundecaprenol N-acetyl-beta-D-mannosaminyltransferase
MPDALVVGGVRVDALQLDSAVDALFAAPGPAAVHLCNAYTVSLAARDRRLREVLNAGTLNLPDGMPMIWIARRLGLAHMLRRVYGPDLMMLALERGSEPGLKHYLYGSTPEVLHALQAQISERWPGACVVGAESPSFSSIADDELVASIARMSAVGADVVWVGMGTPKQDELVHRMAVVGSHRYVAIGAAFDFIAGTKKQAPTWMREHGLEWLFRLVSEPKRLWKRYLVGNTRFLWCILRDRPHLAAESA